MTGLRIALAALLTAGLTVALGALSRAPIQGEHAGEAAIRLTWRLRAEEVGECRRPSPEELAELPSHMRNPDACVGSIPPYRLVAEVDGERLADAVVEAAGARGDRPLYVFRELVVEPGTHTVRVAFEQEGGSTGAAALSWEGTVELEEGEVLLLTRGESGRLEVREPAG